MSRGFLVSILLHAALLVAILVGWPAAAPELVLEQPITVDIVTDEGTEPAIEPPKAKPAETAPLPPREAASPPPPPPAPKPPAVEPKPEPPKPAPPPPPPPPPVPSPLGTSKSVAPAPPQQAEPAPQAAAKEEPKPEPEPPKPAPPPPPPPKPEPAKPTPPPPPKPAPVPPPPVKKPTETDFSALLRSVEELDKRVKGDVKQPGKGATADAGQAVSTKSSAADARARAAMLVGMIRDQITPCWSIPIATKGVSEMRAEIQIVVAADGSVVSAEPVDRARMAADPLFRSFAESARRAIFACAPLKLPPESYLLWRNVIFNFEPSLLAG